MFLLSLMPGLVLHRMLHCAFVRSDYAAGSIESIDASRALARPGVVAVYTYEDLRGQVGRTPCIARPDADRDPCRLLLEAGDQSLDELWIPR